MSREPHNELPAELKAIEAALSALVPRDDGLDHTRLMFLAGRASASEKPPTAGFAWPAAFGSMTLVATTLAVLLLVRPAPEVESGATAGLPSSADQAMAETRALPDKPAVAPLADKSRVTDAPELAFPSGLLASLLFGKSDDARPRDNWKTSYPALRDRILVHGLDSWPTPVSTGSSQPADPPMTQRELLKELTKNHS